MKRLTTKPLLLWISIGVLTAMLFYGVFSYLKHHPSTDDAYVQANTINVAAQVSGPVQAIKVKDHETVAKDQLLFIIDPAPFQIAVDKAGAAVAAQQATLFLAEQNAHRILRLVKSGQESRAAGDQAQSQWDNAKAQLTAYQSQLAQAELDLEHTRITAPRSGIVTQFHLRPGNNVTAGSTLFMLVEQEQFWVDANFKETQLERLRPGQAAKIILDMYPGHTFRGIVEAVSSASGAQFSIMPPENASGNWVKVTQRFPVKIMIQGTDPDFPLRAGATATATVDTTSRA